MLKKPLPPPRSREKYPFHKLEVGECFVIKCAKEFRRSVQQNLSAISRKPSLRGKVFATRTLANGVGVWRVQ